MPKSKSINFIRVLGSMKPGVSVKTECADKNSSDALNTKTSIPSSSPYIVVVKWQSMKSHSPTAYQSQVDVAHAQILKFA